MSFVCRLNPEPIRSPARSVANQEFHANYEHVNEVARRVVRALGEAGVRGDEPDVRVPDGDGPLSRAGSGSSRTSRSPSPPGWGRSASTAASSTRSSAASSTSGRSWWRGTSRTRSRPIDYNPCLECKLCVAACPVGAIGADGHFDFSACVTHNYREFMNGFTDWVSTIADSRDGRDYRRRVSASESASMWQSLSFKANYKAAYCVAVCPAGEDVIGPFLDDRRGFLEGVVDPLKAKEEPIYVVPGSDAEAHVAKRFPRKTIRRVRGLRPASIRGLPLRAEADVPARGLAGPVGHLPLHVHGPGAGRGDRRDPRPHDRRPGRPRRRGPGPDHRGQRHLARLPGARSGA